MDGYTGATGMQLQARMLDRSVENSVCTGDATRSRARVRVNSQEGSKSGVYELKSGWLTAAGNRFCRMHGWSGQGKLSESLLVPVARYKCPIASTRNCS